MSIKEQVILPDEVIIADDGSTEETSNLIKEFSNDFPVEIKHIWHPDEGFRLASIRNKGIAAANGEYIIQIDGDLILHSHFVADHLQLKKPGHFVTGSRVLLSQSSTEKLVFHQSIDLKKWSVNRKNHFNGFRSRFISRLLANRYKIKGKHTYYVKGCNMAFWKKDLMKVNGYNEAFTGWGREDSEIAIRLMNAGIKKQFIKMGAICYHLYHPVASRDMEQENVQMMNEAFQKKTTWIEMGVSQYLLSEMK